MSNRGRIPAALLAAIILLASSAHAQVCDHGICFIDRGASGEINLGPRFGSGSALDYDRDGYQDLVICDASGQLIRLFRNVPDPIRVGKRNFVDATGGSGLDGPEAFGYGNTQMAALAADYDNDGWTDLYLPVQRAGFTTYGLLYRNNRDGTFTNVTLHAGIQGDGDSPETACWVDYDLDGFVDLFIGNRGTSPRPLRLFRNLGDGTFADATDRLPDVSGWTRMYASTWSDIDGDGYPEGFLIASGIPIVLRSQDDGIGGRVFVDASTAIGFTFLGPAPMGITGADYDNDGDFDVAISNGAVGVYYNNAGGVLTRVLPFDSIFAWGITWLDVDNDGWLDHYQAGSVGFSANHNKLFRNLGGDGGGAGFTDISPVLNDLYIGSQFAARADIDNDGREDLLTLNPYNDPVFVSVSENVTTNANHWLKVRLVGDGRRVNTDAIGAVVRIRTGEGGGLVQSREITSGSSTTSTEDTRAHFGLGAATNADWIEVSWPRAGSQAERTERFPGPFAADRIATLRPRCSADWNFDGATNTQDFFEFLQAFFTNAGDFNFDALTNSQDFFDFLAAFFFGC